MSDIGVLSNVFSITLAFVALGYSIYTYVYTDNQSRKVLAYQMLFDINTKVLENPDVVPGNEPLEHEEGHNEAIIKQAAYAAMVWNFIEAVYDLKLYKDVFIRPAVESNTNIYYEWYKDNKDKYPEQFNDYISEIVQKNV